MDTRQGSHLLDTRTWRHDPGDPVSGILDNVYRRLISLEGGVYTGEQKTGGRIPGIIRGTADVVSAGAHWITVQGPKEDPRRSLPGARTRPTGPFLLTCQRLAVSDHADHPPRAGSRE